MKYSIGLAPSPLFLEGVQGLDTIKEMDDFAEQPLLDQGLATLRDWPRSRSTSPVLEKLACVAFDFVLDCS